MGSFYIRKIRDTGWSLMEQKSINGKRVQSTVPKMAYETFGFRADMSLAEAQKRVSKLNEQRTFERNSDPVAVAKRVEKLKVTSKVYLPEDMVEKMEERLFDNQFGSAKNQKKLASHWRTVQLMIKELRLEPHNYSKNKEKFYRYFLDKEISYDYSRKLIRILNMWGELLCQEQGRYFQAVPNPQGLVREKINDTYSESENFQGESDPLTPMILESAREKFEKLSGQYEWLFISVWFGLRPSEIDAIAKKKSTTFKIVHDKKLKVDILWIYQSKLVTIAKEKRWKGIPVIFPEQKKALQFIKDCELKRPLTKVIQRYTRNDQITTYGGRKGFTDLMLSKGQQLEDISMWMGHQSIEMTWQKYKNKKKVSFTPQ